MSTPSASRPAGSVWVWVAPCILICLPASGCWYSGGELLYLLGAGRMRVIPAEFQLSDGPVLVLLDDPMERVDWPPVNSHFVDDVSRQLIEHGAAKKVIPRATIDALRQTVHDFEKRGCREIGKLAGAHQVIWIEVRDFLAVSQVLDPSNAAYFSVSVKVINALEEKNRTRVRLWPTSPTGHAIHVRMDGSEVSMARNKDTIAKELGHRLAGEIAKLFYDHRPDRF